MATIQNARDKLLQAALERFIKVTTPVGDIDGLPGAISDAVGFRVEASDRAFVDLASGVTPASITLRAVTAGAPGTLTWQVVEGTATLTGTGNTRTIAAGSVQTPRVTVRATLTNGDEQRSADYTITRLSVDYYLGILAGKVGRDQLVQELGQEIDLITADATTPGSVAARLAAEARARMEETAALGARIEQESAERVQELQQLAWNLELWGDEIGDVEQRAQASLAELEARRIAALLKETQERIAQYNAVAQGLTTETQERLAAVALARTQLGARIDALNAQVAEILGITAYSPIKAYPAGELVTYTDPATQQSKIYRAVQATTGNVPTNTAYWELVGNYASIGEVLGDLSSRVSTVETTIDGQATRLTAVESTASGSASAITQLQQTTAGQATRLDTISTTVGQHASSITTLQETTGDTAQSLTELSTRVGSTASTVTDLAETTSDHATRLSSVEVVAGATASAVKTLETASLDYAHQLVELRSTLGENDGVVSQIRKTTAGHAQQLTRLSVRAGASESNIVQLFDVTAGQAASLLQLGTRVGTAESGIVTLQETSAGQAQAITTLTTTQGTHSSSIAALDRVTADTALSVSQLSTTVNGHTSSIGTLNETTGQLAQSVQHLATTSGDNTSDITALQRTTGEHATAISTLTTTSGQHTSSITSLQETTSGQAQALTSLRTDVDGNTSSVRSLSETTGQLAQTVNSLSTTSGQHTSNITALQQTTAQQATRIDSMSTTQGEHVSAISSLQQTTGQQAQTISQLGTTVGGHTSSIQAINQTTAQQATRLDTLSTTQGQHTSSITALQQTTAGHAQTIETLETASEEQTASIVALRETTEDHAQTLITLSTTTDATATQVQELAQANEEEAFLLATLMAEAGDSDSFLSEQSRVNATQAQRITQLQSDIKNQDGYASAVAFDALATEVRDSENGLSATATRVTQLQATVDDETAAIRQELSATADELGHVAAKYAVQIQAGNIMGGYALIGTAGGDTPPTIKVAYRVSDFMIAPPTGSTGVEQPFVYKTADSYENGALVRAGLYLGSLYVRSASMVDAAVSTIKIQGNAVTVPYGTEVGTAQDIPQSGSWTTGISLAVDANDGAFMRHITAIISVAMRSTRAITLEQSGRRVMAQLRMGTTVIAQGSCSIYGGNGNAIQYLTIALAGRTTLSGTCSVRLQYAPTMNNTQMSATEAQLEHRSIIVMGVKR